jgi:glucose/arabinose dehydrogenase
MKHISFAFFLLIVIQSSFAQKVIKGQNLFQLHCGSCHGIIDGAFGPKLGGVTEVRSKKEIIDFIKNPNAFIDAKEPRAIALFEKYKSEMPAFAQLKKNELEALVSYIEERSNALNISPLSLSEIQSSDAHRRFAPPVKPSNLYIELEDVVNIPRTSEHLDDKGITTVRSAFHGLFINDQMGQIYRINNKKAELYFDLRKVTPDFIFFPSIGAGLGSFAFHPDFENNGLLYITHNEKYAGKPAINENDWPYSVGTEHQWVIEEWKTNNPNGIPFVGTRREVLRINTPTFGHSGQDLKFHPNIDRSHPDYGILFYGHGDGGTANLGLPQYSHHIRSVLGSILRIDPQGTNGVLPTYGIPKDNPFAEHEDPKVQKEIYAYGFRNPYRFCWNDEDLYVADIGESDVEELNVIIPGGDYGWATQEGIYGKDVAKDKTLMFDRMDKGVNNSILPVITYDHTDGNAISGGSVYEGDLAALKGKYFFGDIVKGRLFYTDPNNFDQGVFEVNIIREGEPTNMQELVGIKRTHLRIGYDEIGHDLYILTKPDNTLRKVAKAYFK